MLLINATGQDIPEYIWKALKDGAAAGGVLPKKSPTCSCCPASSATRSTPTTLGESKWPEPGEPMTYATHVEFELRRATFMTGKDGRQRWVTMDGTIHETAVPYRDAISVHLTNGVVTYAYRDRVLAHPAIGAI